MIRTPQLFLLIFSVTPASGVAYLVVPEEDLRVQIENLNTDKICSETTVTCLEITKARCKEIVAPALRKCTSVVLSRDGATQFVDVETSLRKIRRETYELNKCLSDQAGPALRANVDRFATCEDKIFGKIEAPPNMSLETDP